MTHLVLVGLMATGKSTVGHLVAERLGRPVVDTDDLVERRAGRTVREIWTTDGEAAFRALETEVLRELLGDAAPVVVAGGGGIVLAEENRRLLADADADVVWLRATPTTLLARIEAADDGHRPLLDDDPAGMLERMERERRDHYEAVADHIVDVDDRDPIEVAEAVAEVIR